MKKVLFGISFISLLASCSKEKETFAPEIRLTEMTDSSSVLNNAGHFSNGPYGNVSGSAKVYKNNTEYLVQLDSFATNNGPDLYVYLSKEIMPVNFISLGKLKSTSGSQVYPVPPGTDVQAYQYVCVHCRQYNHLFGYALLQ
jgi:Electron transfer DM13